LMEMKPSGLAADAAPAEKSAAKSTAHSISARIFRFNGGRLPSPARSAPQPLPRGLSAYSIKKSSGKSRKIKKTY